MFAQRALTSTPANFRESERDPRALHSAHGLLFRSSNTIFTLVLRFREGSEETTDERKLYKQGRYWLAFVKAACAGRGSGMYVIIVGNVMSRFTIWPNVTDRFSPSSHWKPVTKCDGSPVSSSAPVTFSTIRTTLQSPYFTEGPNVLDPGLSKPQPSIVQLVEGPSPSAAKNHAADVSIPACIPAPSGLPEPRADPARTSLGSPTRKSCRQPSDERHSGGHSSYLGVDADATRAHRPGARPSPKVLCRSPNRSVQRSRAPDRARRLSCQAHLKTRWLCAERGCALRCDLGKMRLRCACPRISQDIGISTLNSFTSLINSPLY
eukprot:m.287083 g.287083  ORF g.287083 m.287083 type:complete len:322 (+) comp40701_c0_seq47:1527-2492(+)